MKEREKVPEKMKPIDGYVEPSKTEEKDKNPMPEAPPIK